MRFGASLKFAAARDILEKQNQRTTFTKYVGAQFGRTNAFLMVGGRSARFICRVISSVSRTVKFIDLRPRQSSTRRSGSQSAGPFFTSFAKGNIRAANNVRHLITRTLEHAENHLLLLGRQNSLEKVAAFLLEMDHRLEHPNVMALPMSRRDIADYLGMTLETVSRSLSSFRDEGILSFTEKNHREIVLHDRSTLAERATPV